MELDRAVQPRRDILAHQMLDGRRSSAGVHRAGRGNDYARGDSDDSWVNRSNASLMGFGPGASFSYRIGQCRSPRADLGHSNLLVTLTRPAAHSPYSTRVDGATRGNLRRPLH
jgi:hypothetical protein